MKNTLKLSTCIYSADAVPMELIQLIRASRRVVVLTGAGMSAESGIPTFRDALTGLWSRFDPEELATEAGFRRNPALVWRWYESRRRAVLQASPNAGHVALCSLGELSWIEDLTIVTQNVDNLHERAGSTEVIHLHGSLFAPRCISCGTPAGETEPDASHELEDIGQPSPLVHCMSCDGWIRPGVVWFGEDLPDREWDEALERTNSADLMLVIGTSGRVYPAASLPDMAVEKGCPVWVIDPDKDLAPGERNVWCTTAALALPCLVSACMQIAGLHPA